MSARSLLTIVLRCVLGAGAVLLVLWSAVHGLDAVLFHGFSVMCSDGSPDFDPEVCGITWTPGLRHLVAGALGLLMLCACVGRMWFCRTLLLTTGVLACLLAVFLLWITTWQPVNPLHPEPPGPQVILLGVGLMAVLVGSVPWRQPAAVGPRCER
ncbi:MULTISPECIES: hypothetical protein [unclassified Aeromicrobium]|uniref:hypothetical protein n=1 Tax=unclassified Aeromicrobium TaxID=2633570 RepID=UPI00396B38C4